MKTALVTGTTSGIGREVVKGLLAAGYEVIAHGRSVEKLEREKAAWASDRVSTVVANLDSRQDVVRMAGEVAARAPKLDLLIHNAAVVPKARVETVDGLDVCFATNVLAPYILTRHLEPQLRAGAPSRVIFYWGGNHDKLDVDDMRSRKARYDGFTVYSESKNACALLAAQMSKELEGSGVSAFAVVPGLVNTEGMRGLDNFFFSRVGVLFFRTPEQGARTPLWVATEPGLESKSGTCFGNALGSGWRNETRLPASAKDVVLGEKVRALCASLDVAS